MNKVDSAEARAALVRRYTEAFKAVGIAEPALSFDFLRTEDVVEDFVRPYLQGD